MAIRLYTDEHVARAVVRGLRARGVDVVSSSEGAGVGASDLDHLAWARESGRVIFTQDTDFLRLHDRGTEHAGIIYARQGTGVGTLVSGLMLIVQLLTPEEMVGHIEFV